MRQFINVSEKGTMKKILFFDGFISYTNELFAKTGKKIKTIGQFKKAYEVYKIKDFNGNRTYDSLKEYPSVNEAFEYTCN